MALPRWMQVTGVVAASFGALLWWGVFNVRATPVARATTVALAGWEAPPFRIALLSDIHMGGVGMDAARLRRVVAAVNAAKPDLVVLAGDFVNGHKAGTPAQVDDLTAPLADLSAPQGVVAVLGNHDYWTSPSDVRRALEAAHVTVLENGAVQRGPVALAGVADAFSGHDRIDDTLASARLLHGPIIVLSHSPDIVTRLPADTPVLLAGHTHCGQIVLPLIGPPVTRAPSSGRPLYNPHYRCGVVRDPGRVTVVTGGVGSGTAPVRFGAPPDWWLVTLDGPR